MKSLNDGRHTPGPWAVYKHGEALCVDTDPQEDNPMDIVCLVTPGEPGFTKRAEKLATAQLISAAPELLDCLLDCHDAIIDLLPVEWDNKTLAEITGNPGYRGLKTRVDKALEKAGWKAESVKVSGGLLS